MHIALKKFQAFTLIAYEVTVTGGKNLAIIANSLIVHETICPHSFSSEKKIKGKLPTSMLMLYIAL